MNLSFQIKCRNLDDFINHWPPKYSYKTEYKYDDNIGKPLTQCSRLELFEWKNSSIISAKKLKSIRDNYPLRFKGNKKKRYLNHKEGGGAIWNIFYLHCLEPDRWPIYDQHTYRAMMFIQTGDIIEIKESSRFKYESYVDEFIPFFNLFSDFDQRDVDKALFSFGQFLKLANKYS